MMRVPAKNAKCRKAVYPSHAWQDVPCAPAPKHTLPTTHPSPTHPAVAELVGGGAGDFHAQSANSIVSAQGLFEPGSGIANVTSVATGATPPCSNASLPNEYSIQLNTNTFNTSACTTAGCVGWQQFVFSNSSSGSLVYMQYWMIGHGPNCPQGWNASGNSCFKNSDQASGPFQDVSKLADFRLYATAADPNAGGRDSLYVHLPTGEMIGATGDANVLGLNGHWNLIEFNVFGNHCSRQANFNAGVSLTAVVQYIDNTNQPPTCPNGSTTGEMNSLSVVNPCCQLGGMHQGPGIIFTESNVAGTKSFCDCPSNLAIVQRSASVTIPVRLSSMGSARAVALRLVPTAPRQTSTTAVVECALLAAEAAAAAYAAAQTTLAARIHAVGRPTPAGDRDSVSRPTNMSTISLSEPPRIGQTDPATTTNSRDVVGRVALASQTSRADPRG